MKKYLSKIMSIVMLTFVIGGLTYPVGSKTAMYFADEIEENTPQGIYTKEDLLNSKNGEYYEGNITNIDESTLEYNVSFKEFSDSEALAKINNKTITINSEGFSGQVFEGETQGSIEYIIDASGVNKDIIEDLTVTQMPNSNIENVDNVEDTTEEVDDTATSLEETDVEADLADDSTGETDVVNEDSINSKNTRAAEDADFDETFYPKKSSISAGGESGKGELALIANDVTVVGRGKDFDTGGFGDNTKFNFCHKAHYVLPDGILVPPFIWSMECKNNDLVAYSKITSNFKADEKSGDYIVTAPSLDSDGSWMDLMNIQARTSDGQYVSPENITIEADGNYTTDYAKWNKNITGDYEYNVEDSDYGTLTDKDILSPFWDGSDYKGYSQYTFTISASATNPSTGKTETNSVNSTVTVVDPFFDWSLVDSTETDYADLIENPHHFGNVWTDYTSRALYNATQDIVLDVNYKYEDPKYNEAIGEWDFKDSEDGLTSEGENAYLPSKNGEDYNEVNSTLNRKTNEIPGYELYVPMDSPEDKEAESLITRYFNNFMITTGTSPDDERDISTNEDGTIVESAHPNEGYLGIQGDVSEDTQTQYPICSAISYGEVNVEDYPPLSGDPLYPPAPEVVGTQATCDDNGSEEVGFSLDAELPITDDKYPVAGEDDYFKEGKYITKEFSGEDKESHEGDATYNLDGIDESGFVINGQIDAQSTDVYQGLANDVINAPEGTLWLVDDGDYDNSVAGVYNLVIGYRMDNDEFSKGLGDVPTGLEDLIVSPDKEASELDQGSTDVYMLLPVVVQAAPVIAADDTEVWQHDAPNSEEDLKDVMDVEALGLQALKYSEAKDYNEANACIYDENGGEDGAGLIDGSYIGTEQCPNPEKEHYVNNYYDDISVKNWFNDYDYKDPQVGSYVFTFYYDFDGTPGLSGQDPQRDAILYVVDNNEDIHNADLQGSTPVAAKNELASASYDDLYNVYKEINPALVKYENEEFSWADQGEDELSMSAIDLIDSGTGDFQDNQTTLLVIQVAYRNLQTQMIVEVQYTGDGKPWKNISNQVWIDAIDPLTIPRGSDFDPLVTTEPTAWDANYEEAHIAVDVNGVNPNLLTGDSQEVGLIAYQHIQGDYYAQAYKVVEVYVDESTSDVVIEGVDDITLNVGDEFDPLKDVTATSVTDGDITENIEIVENNVDTSKEGDYLVKYYAEDSIGEYSEAQREVKVVSGDDGDGETDGNGGDNGNGSGGSGEGDKDSSNNGNGGDTITGGKGDSNGDDDSTLTPTTDEESLTNTGNTSFIFMATLSVMTIISYAFASKKHNK